VQIIPFLWKQFKSFSHQYVIINIFLLFFVLYLCIDHPSVYNGFVWFSE